MSFKPELSTDGGKTFHANGLAFATREEAELSAQDTFGRWMLATDWRAVESDQPVNYEIVDGVMSAVGVAGVPA
jgi:hypothetical protein